MAYASDFQFFMQPGGDIVVKELSIIPIDSDIDRVDVTKVVHFYSNHDFEYKINWAAQNVKLINKFIHAQK